MNLKTSLMPHQILAVKKMMTTKVGALFMEMGTGKTRTILEIISKRKNKISNVIYFCPVSIKETIKKEIIKHSDITNIFVFDSKTNNKNIVASFVYIVGIESMSNSSRVILTVNNLINKDTFVIVDESTYIKGHNSIRTKWITEISMKAKYRFIMTGTPITQGVVDLYSQFRFLSPKILGYSSFYSFAANHLEYSEKFPGMLVKSHNVEWIATKIKPYIYQINKKDCVDLPDKLYETFYFNLTTEQREVYEMVKNEALENCESWDSYTIFQLFSRLQQITCGFLNYKKISFKHERISLLDDIIKSIPVQEKIIIWCKYEYDINAVSNYLSEYKVSKFYGKLNIKDREKSIEEFKNEKRFFITTQSCGGHGLTLNESSFVIFYNNSFKYSERIQAEDRNHRIGQTNKVTYIDIICNNTIDERIQQCIHNKKSIADEFKKELNKNNIKKFIKKL